MISVDRNVANATNDKINKKPFIKNNQKLLYFMTYIFSDKFIIHRQK